MCTHTPARAGSPGQQQQQPGAEGSPLDLHALFGPAPGGDGYGSDWEGGGETGGTEYASPLAPPEGGGTPVGAAASSRPRAAATPGVKW